MVSEDIEKLPVIDVILLFPEVNKSLIDLLSGLKEEDWNKSTVLPGRKVKDLVSHILDSSLRRLSTCRDNYQVDSPDIRSYEDLVKYIQKLNKIGMEFYGRLSPTVLISLLKESETWLYEYFKTLKLDVKAKLPVAWAGEEESLNWFDIAREYTEKWHHQMQIRLAVNKVAVINSRKLFYPVIDIFMRGLPHAYRHVKAANNTEIEFEIKGNGGGTWFLENFNNKWRLAAKLKKKSDAKIVMSDDIAWRIFADSIDYNEAAKEVDIYGNKDLGVPILKMKCVMR
ncbi:MAG: maleylpyruvate isomerase N-terminal domain-containing protein [Candidatus Thorarchaeota archaeon]